MKIDPKSGIIEITSELILCPRMMRRDFLSINIEWEDWDIVDNIPRSFRTIIKLPNKGISPKTVLVVHGGLDDRPITFWDLAPWDLMEGTQSRPNGKHTKRMRNWFKDAFGVGLPLKREWGHVDAYFDPWNQTASVICNYRERFDSDAKWSEYKKNNGY
jgi:hypothetical protein